MQSALCVVEFCNGLVQLSCSHRCLNLPACPPACLPSLQVSEVAQELTSRNKQLAESAALLKQVGTD